ncbi:MAG: leucine-rich repeat domain-containing protein [Lachnospiraceae bacterium]|nr:leucine-rich repeat domain-containing protein [Lachnospiraceae bacterium]
MKCPGCGSTLKMPSDGGRFVKCEYCGGEYAIEGVQGSTVPRKTPDWKPAPVVKPKEQEVSKATTIFYRCLVIVLFAAGIWYIVSSEKSKKEEAEKQELYTAIEQNTYAGYGQSDGAEEKFPGLLGELISAAFGKDAEDVTAQELSQIKWVADKADFDYTYIGYSFDDPLENPDAEITWLTYPKGIGIRYENGYERLNMLEGLKKFETINSISECNLEGLKLESLTASVSSPEAAAAAVDDPSLICELGIRNNIQSLEGIELFPNVEKLSVSASSLNDVSAVTAIAHLKSLTLEDADALNDFAVFGSIENLEELIIESENIKVLNFLNRMPQLKSLGISDAKLLDLNGIEVLEKLEKLSVTDCGELKDMKAVESLTGLKELTLERPYDCEEPSLAGLTGLESLSLKSFRSCDFLQNMTNLKKLSLQSCGLPEGIDLSGLTQLKEFQCTSSLDKGSFAFISGITSLESVNMKGITTYEDISGIFMLPNLEKLDISGAECEIDFDKVTENPSLESLEMAGMTLYENVRVSGGGGILYVQQDDVFLSDHLDFLTAFPNLKHLNIAGNEIKDVDFAENLGKLEEMDFSDNYVTELRPLAAIPSLRLVNCKGNPIGNLQALDDKVIIISD